MERVSENEWYEVKRSLVMMFL